MLFLHSKSAVPASHAKKAARVFKPQLLRHYRTDGEVESYRYGSVIISEAHDGERIYVSVNRPLPSEITDGMLAWFGMDTVDEATIQFRDITKIESESHIFEQAWEGADE